jgi:hypothetical protein
MDAVQGRPVAVRTGRGGRVADFFPRSSYSRSVSRVPPLPSSVVVYDGLVGGDAAGGRRWLHWRLLLVKVEPAPGRDAEVSHGPRRRQPPLRAHPPSRGAAKLPQPRNGSPWILSVAARTRTAARGLLPAAELGIMRGRWCRGLANSVNRVDSLFSPLYVQVRPRLPYSYNPTVGYGCIVTTCGSKCVLILIL